MITSLDSPLIFIGLGLSYGSFVNVNYSFDTKDEIFTQEKIFFTLILLK